MRVSRDMFKDWMAIKGFSERTIQEYSYYLKRFYYNKFNQSSLRQFIGDQGNNNSVSKGMLKNLKEFLIQNRKELNLSEKELQDIKDTELPRAKRRTKMKLKSPLDIKEIYFLEDYLEGERMKLMLLISFFGGVRVDELFKITEFDIDWEPCINGKPGGIIIKGKGGKERVVSIPIKVMRRLKAFQENKKDQLGIPIFNIGNGTRATQVRYWQRALLKAGEEASIVRKDAEGNIIKGTSVHPHRLRHSCASYLLEMNLDIIYIQEYLGHADISTTQIYAHVNPKIMKEKVAEVYKEY